MAVPIKNSQGLITTEIYCPKDLAEWANSDVAIQWFLYDANLLPEQIDTLEKVCALRGFQYGWKAADKRRELRIEQATKNPN